MKSTKASWTVMPSRCSTAALSSARTRRRPTPSRPIRIWFCPTTPSSTPSRNCRSWLTTCAAPTATIGQLDDEAMFYLQSRGIGKHDARSLLTYAFAQDIIDRIKVPSLKESLERILFEKFHEHAQ